MLINTLWIARLAEEGVAPTLDPIVIPIVIILVLLNGIFVAAEFAMLGARATRMEQLAEEGNATAGHVQGILESSDKINSYLATAQLGITIVTLGLAIYAEPRIAHWLEPKLEVWFGWSHDFAARIGYFIVIGVLTYLHVVFGEMIPKSLALTDANRWVLILDRFMSLLQSVLRVPIWILNGIGNLMLRLMRVPPADGHARLYSPEEIEQIISESSEGGLIDADAEEMIQNIFDFSDRTVGQVMTPRRKMLAFSVDMPKDELLTKVASSRFSRFPIFEGDNDHILGVLHLKDLAEYVLNNGRAFDLRTIMRDAPRVAEDIPVEEMLALFKAEQMHMAVVFDEYGGTSGIVTLEDLVEEVVGEVRDEFDFETEPYLEVDMGVIECAGDYLLADLQHKVYLGEVDELPDVDTVGGLIITKLGEPPAPGREVVFNDDVTMTVLTVDGRAVTRVQIEYPVIEEPSAETDEAPSTDDESAH